MSDLKKNIFIGMTIFLRFIDSKSLVFETRQSIWHVKRLLFVVIGVFVEDGITQAILGIAVVVLFCVLQFYAWPFDLTYLDLVGEFQPFGYSAQ